MRLERVVVFGELDAVQVEHVDMIGAHQARANCRGSRPPARACAIRLPWNCALVAITTWSRGMVFSALPDHAFGAVGRRGVDEVDAEPDAPRGSAAPTSSSVLPALRPSREKPPVPRPATETAGRCCPRWCIALPDPVKLFAAYCCDLARRAVDGSAKQSAGRGPAAASARIAPPPASP